MAQTACQIAWRAGLSSAAGCLRDDEIVEREGPNSAVNVFVGRATRCWLAITFVPAIVARRLWMRSGRRWVRSLGLRSLDLLPLLRLRELRLGLRPLLRLRELRLGLRPLLRLRELRLGLRPLLRLRELRLRLW